MYWTIGQFPELDHLEPHERAQLLRRVPRGFYFSIIWRYALLGLLLGLPVCLYAFKTGTGTEMPAFWITALACTFAGYTYELRRLRRSLRQTIAEAFRGERLPFCMNCGYDLRMAAGEQCPECGARVMVE